eukprot:scaffold3070_cov133-Isochrysis_galbana.AAC.5
MLITAYGKQSSTRSTWLSAKLREFSVAASPHGRRARRALSSSWRTRRMYGAQLHGRPCVLKMRSKHSAFKECTACQDLRLKLKNALKRRLNIVTISAIKAEIQLLMYNLRFDKQRQKHKQTHTQRSTCRLYDARSTAECAACDGSCCRHSHALPSAASVAWLLANFAYIVDSDSGFDKW